MRIGSRALIGLRSGVPTPRVRSWRPIIFGYALAIAAVVLALGLRAAFTPVMGDRSPFMFMLAAVLLTAWYAGRGPGVAATVLGAAATSVIFAHELTSRTYAIALIAFAGASAVIVGLTAVTRRAQTAGRHAHERLELALTSTEMGVWELDLRTHAVWWSESLEPVYGLPRGAFGRTLDAFRSLIHSDDRALFDAAIDRAVASRGAYAIEYRFVRPDGTLRWICSTGRVFCDEHGDPQHMVGTSRDVTAHREAAEIEQRFDAVMTHAPLVVFAKDRDGRYLMTNALFTQLAGVSEDQILGKTDDELFDPPVAAAFRSHDLLVIASGESRQFEETFTFNRATHTFLFIKFPLCDSSGNRVAVCGIANDITARKEAEAALQDADRRKDEFLAILAHELRNPLAPIRLALEMLRTNDSDKAINARALDVMGRQLAQLVRLIDDLLDVSRITRGKLELRRARVQLADVIKTAIETSRPQIDAAKHELVLDVPDEPIALQADLTRLAQVIANLLNNAAKYTPKGGTITLAAKARRDELDICVSDTGIGLAPQHLPNVFDMFAQVAPLTTRAQGGLGIGLALARALIEMHGGRIEAASEGEGKGCTFTIHLPIASAIPNVDTSGELALGTLGKLRVVVADDNVDAIETLAMFLESAGHSVHTANDGAAALAAIKEFKPDVAVLDIGMPKMDGYEVARHLRAEAAGRDLVLIALTGWGQAEDHRRSREAGFDYHLIKPVQPSTLVKLLSSASRTS